MTSSYLDLFDRSSIDPEPASETATASASRWRFARPPGDTLVVSVDLQVQFGRHWGRAGTVAVLEHGKPVVHASFKTWLAP